MSENRGKTTNGSLSGCREAMRKVCVMFLDIRNFTANARSKRPEQVVEFLNATFGFMIESIDRQGGFINKFLGDGFMAIFGAPLDDPAAAHHAVAAAQEILVEIDRRGLADDAWPLRVGIGLHIGDAVTGNVGSPRRKEFTAIGDTVNFAFAARAAHEGTQRPPHRVRCDGCGNRQRSPDRDEARRSDGERLRRAGEHLATRLKPAVVRIAWRTANGYGKLPPRCSGGALPSRGALGNGARIFWGASPSKLVTPSHF